MSENENTKAIDNAEEVIERFGGIRPMAKKIDVAVTTIQGWKKRNTIPGARREMVIEAAGEHNIDLSDIIEGAPAVSADIQVDKEPPANENAQSESVEEQDKSGEDKPEEVIELKADTKVASPITASGSVPRSKDRGAAKAPEDLVAKLEETEHKAITKSTWINVALILITVAAVLTLLWPESKGSQNRLASLEQNVDGLEGDVSAVKEQQSFLSTLIPEDLDQRISDLQDKAQGVKDKAVEVRDSSVAAVEKVQEISDDVLAEGAGTIEERAAKLQTHFGELSSDPRFAALMARFEGMNDSLLGQQKLNGSVGQLGALLGGLGASETANINETIDAARQEDPALNETFDGVPKQDLKAAALLLGMSQFRQSLNRDNQPFEDDLALLQKLVGEDNPELNEALARLAPRAEEGVLTPGGLSDEFKTIAGDVVVSSLKGEDVSFKEKAAARVNEVFQVEKDGELITGTPTQATVSKAENLLQSGDIAGAISQMQSLDGDQAAIAQPWIDEAQATLMAQELKKFMSGAASGNLMQGIGVKGQSELIQDKETGINILKPSPGAGSVLDKKNPFQDNPFQ